MDDKLIAACSALQTRFSAQDREIEAMVHDLDQLSVLSTPTALGPSPPGPCARIAHSSPPAARAELAYGRGSRERHSEPQQATLPEEARAALERYGAKALLEVRSSARSAPTGAAGFVDRRVLTLALERAGARLSRRSLRALHTAVAAGRQGFVHVEHLARLVAACRAAARPHPRDGLAQVRVEHPKASPAPSHRWSDRDPARSPLPPGHEGVWRRQREQEPPSGAPSARGGGVGLQRAADAVEAVVARVRDAERRLRLYGEPVGLAHWSLSSLGAGAPEAGVESAALRRCLADADATIHALLARLERAEGHGMAAQLRGSAAGMESHGGTPFAPDESKREPAPRGQRASFEAYAASFRQRR